MVVQVAGCQHEDVEGVVEGDLHHAPHPPHSSHPTHASHAARHSSCSSFSLLRDLGDDALQQKSENLVQE